MKNAIVRYPFHGYSNFIAQSSFWTTFSTTRFTNSKHFQDLIFAYMVDYVLPYFTRVMKTLRPIASNIFRELEPKNCWFFVIFAVTTWSDRFDFYSTESGGPFYL